MHILRFQSTLPRGERRATTGCVTLRGYISIHAPAWGATVEKCKAFLEQDISIHAPAWGATCTSATFMPVAPDFNPRSRVGSDPDFPGLIFILPEFQSTLPRGERPRPFPALLFSLKFQSTLPRGERQRAIIPSNTATAFQSTLPRGERLYQAMCE